MKNLTELWDDLTWIGKLFSWWIIPVYYSLFFILTVVGVVFYGIVAAWHDMK